MEMIFLWIILSLSLYVTALLVPGFHVRSFGSSIVAVTIVGLLNIFIRPLLMLLALPINFLTLGLFTFVVNAIILRIAAGLLKGFDIDGWFSALIGAVVLAVIQSLALSFFNFSPALPI